MSGTGSLALAFGLALGLASALIPVMQRIARQAGLGAVPRGGEGQRPGSACLTQSNS